MTMTDLRDRYLGALLGLACGDAVGTAVEFSPRGTFDPVTDMVGGGPFKLKPGQWTDDTSMALCLAESLLAKDGFDPADQMNRYLNWWEWGYLSSTGDCFDIGNTVRNALQRFVRLREPYSGATDPHTAGNGSLMRLAPVVLFAHHDPLALHAYAAHSSRTTHGAPEAVESCQLFAELISRALAGHHRDKLLDGLLFKPQQPKIAALADGAFLEKDAAQIFGTGYCVASLEAALWCFYQTASFEAAVLKAVNLGDDADTTGAIVGQLAGAYYGVEAIPVAWLGKLAMRDEIEAMAAGLFARFGARQ
ncbi:ADP-ribosylglycohydrolase family protein [Janthinobacterium sp. 17J80-10]|nr:ADP-ribosylglycohydrolase family protein [Janthinobacterium sp. 17J80-10]